jgi:hypothetical protein
MPSVLSSLAPAPRSGVDPTKLWEALPSEMGSDADLDRVLKRVCRIKDGDGVTLGATRALLQSNRIVVRDDRGLWIKAAEFPRFPTDDELLKARQAEEIKQMESGLFTPNGLREYAPEWNRFDGRIEVDDPRHSRFRERRELDAHTKELFAPEFEALHQELAELRGQIAALADQRITA